MHRSSPPTRAAQRGTTLLEALVAFLVLSLGMLSVARVQTHMRLNADIARQRAEAVRLGQEAMEKLRAFSVLAATPGLHAYADIASGSASVESGEGVTSATRYQLARRIDDANPDPSGVTRAKAATVSVGWTDRSGAAQQIVLDSIIAGSDPVLTGALALGPSGAPVRGAFGRSVRIPHGAVDVGKGRSAWRPAPTSTVALLFDTVTGLVIGRCQVATAVSNRNLRAADLTGCDTEGGLLLTGTVRFASAAASAPPPDPAQAREAPLPLDVALALTGGSGGVAPRCGADAVDTGTDRYLAYHCVVPVVSGGAWSGRVTLRPDGWTVGFGALDRKVCRYSADLDASGAVDANVEHPAAYVGVSAALAQQNYLVVRGSDACPTARPVQLAGGAGDVFADLGTVQHQP